MLGCCMAVTEGWNAAPEGARGGMGNCTAWPHQAAALGVEGDRPRLIVQQLMRLHFATAQAIAAKRPNLHSVQVGCDMHKRSVEKINSHSSEISLGIIKVVSKINDSRYYAYPARRLGVNQKSVGSCTSRSHNPGGAHALPHSELASKSCRKVTDVNCRLSMREQEQLRRKGSVHACVLTRDYVCARVCMDWGQGMNIAGVLAWGQK